MNRRWIKTLALLALLCGRSAHATVDPSGPWYASADLLGMSCALQFDTSAGLRITGDCTPELFTAIVLDGTLDAETGSFAASGTSSPLCALTTIEGVVASDGRSFAATVTCVSFGISFALQGSRCGNGVVDQDEQCDDGGRQDGDCCSALCEAAPNGSPCDDDNSCTTGDQCQTGVCETSTLPDGSSCDDDDACTEGDACLGGSCVAASPVTCEDACQTCDHERGCVFAPDPSCGPYSPAARLTVKDHPDARRDSLAAEVSGATGLTIGDLGDPRADTGYDVCVYDGAGLLARATAPPGGFCGNRPCWTPRVNGYDYRAVGADGLQSLALRLNPSGRFTLKVRGKGSSLGIGPLPASGDLPAVQLRGSNGLCVGAAFPGWRRNGPILAEARRSAGGF